MNYLEFFYPDQAKAEFQRRVADAEREDFEELARENAELRLYLTALTQVLVKKGVIRFEEVQWEMQYVSPPAPTTNEPPVNPFAKMLD